jgi:Protein of unknown function (DUF4242)
MKFVPSVLFSLLYSTFKNNETEIQTGLPKFLDVHSLKDVDDETLRKLQRSPIDEFGVTHDNMMYNREVDKMYCLLDAPNKDAVLKHHEKYGFKCEWIMEIKTTRTN